MSVDIEWGEMAFTYTPAHTIWNPATHDYDAPVEAAWTAEGNEITVTNQGSDVVRADFSCSIKDGVSGVSGGFRTAAAEALSSELSVELAAATFFGLRTVPATVYFELSGAIDGDVSDLATITITIIAE